jgi:beta-glucosidase
MNKSLAIVCAVIVVVGLAVFFIKQYQESRLVVDTRYLDASLPIEERVEILLSQMTLEEKVGQMALVEKNSLRSMRHIEEYSLGGLLSGGGSKPDDNTPEGWRKMVEEFDRASRKTRLGIPVLYGVDAIHGHGNVSGATIFPHAIGLGAAGDSELVERIAAATADEIRATGVSWVFSPNLDVPQDIRWGRTYETYSGDSRMTGEMGSAFVRGLQGIDPEKANLVATAKHYLGAGGMRWDTSISKNYRIDQGATDADESALREFYMPPFKQAVDAGVLSVMAGLNSYDGKKISASEYLLTDVLKDELGFKGFVVSDWYGVYEITENKYDAAVTAINAGIDMVMLPFEYATLTRDIARAARAGDIPQERVDDAVRRILRAKFAIGLFEGLPSEPIDTFGSAEHRALAREAVSKSLVLLKNENQTFADLRNAQKIFVAGSAADNTGMQASAWTIEWQGVDGSMIPGATSILEGITDAAGSDTQVVYDAKANFVTDGSLADVGIAIVGERPYAEGFGDSDNPTFTAEDLETISLVQKASKKVIVVIVSGRPLILPPQFETWDAIVAAWFPGSEGAGVADALFGLKPFTGKLPLPWPSHIRQSPFGPDGVSADGTEPLFERGFGL